MTITHTLHPPTKTDAVRLERTRYVDDTPAAIALAREYGYSAARLAESWWGLESPSGELRTASHGSWLVFGPEQVQVLTDQEYQAARP